MRLVFLIASLALLTSCTHQRVAHVNAARPLTVEEVRIVEIARRAVATNDIWVDHAEFELPRHQPEGGWSIMVWRLSATPGGFRIITIDEKDKVTAYQRGY